MNGTSSLSTARWLGKAVDRISFAFAFLSGIMLLVCVLAVFYGVVARYVIHRPPSWVIEASTYLFIWFSFLAMAQALRDETHVRVTLVISNLFSQKMQALLEMAQYFLCLVYGSILSVYGIIAVKESFALGDESMMVHMPMWIIHLSIPVGILLFNLQAIRKLIGKCYLLRTKHLETTPQLRNNPWFVFPLLALILFAGILLLHFSTSIGTVILLLTLLATGTHVGASLGLTAATFFYFNLGGAPMLRTLPAIGISAVGSWVLLAAPLFILVGAIIHHSRMVAEIFEAVKKWTGRLVGCLGASTIVTSAVFAAISGGSAPNAAALSDACVPQLLKSNYNKRMATGAVAAGGTLGILIPPSLAMILYGSLTDESVGELFMAGLIPGIILSLMFIIYIIIRCKQTGQHENYEPTTWRDKYKSTKSALTGFIMPIIILGCIYSGIVTPTEAASIAVMYGLVVALATKRFAWRDIMPILIRSSIISSMLIFILVGAMAIGNMTAILKVPQNVSQTVAASNIPGWSVIVLMMLAVMLLGMFLDGISITLLIVPTIYPLIVSLGFNPVWFAVLLTVNFELATMTPPVGMNLYIVHGVTKIPMADVIRGSFPFMILLIVGLIIFAFVPQLSLWLPSVMK